MLDKNKTDIKPILQDIQRIKPIGTVQDSAQKFSRSRRSIFVGMLASLFLALLIMAGAITLFAYQARKPVLDFGKTILQENLQFLYSQRYVFFPSSSQDAGTLSPADKQIQDKIKSGSVIEEASAMKKSKQADWWLNSGGIMYWGQQEFSTNLGALPKDSSWRKLYEKTNSKDTDQGYFPQNIFRLVTRTKWKNLSQSVYFNIDKINTSKSNNRSESNGVLLFNRYQDGANLYYVGVRVDGDAVIKKKIDEKYYTMAETKIFSSDSGYDRDTNPNLIPTGVWIGLKSEVVTDSDNVVHISLSVDQDGQGWKSVMEAIDKDDKYGAAPIADKGYAGIRTDFMDVHFRDYHIEETD